jgi:hypothetical protein
VATVAALAKRERVGFSDFSVNLPREFDPNPEPPPLWFRPLAMMIELPRQSTPVRIVASLIMLAAILAVIAGIISRTLPLACLILVVMLASGLGYTWCAPRPNPGVDPTPIE